tara:strand:- start:1040 stop:1162 length:123 start_codon:yes stop_codon:yes gene_type:complete
LKAERYLRLEKMLSKIISDLDDLKIQMKEIVMKEYIGEEE